MILVMIIRFKSQKHNALEITRGLGIQNHDIMTYTNLFSLTYEFEKILYKGAV